MRRSMLERVIIAFAAGAIATGAGAAKAPSGPMPKRLLARDRPGATAPADSTYLLSIVRDLADPRLEGRGVGTAGIDSAAQHLARRMKALGLKPGGEEGGYFQSIEVTTGVEVGPASAIEIGGRRWEVGEDFQPIGFSTNGTLREPVMFAGYGITAPGYDYDDYAGIDVRDKIVLVLAQEPGEMDSTSRFDGSVNTPHADLRTKAIVAREHGALALLVVDGPRYHAGEPLRKPRTEGGGYMTSGLLAARISRALADELMRPAGIDLATAQDAIEAHGRPHSMFLGRRSAAAGPAPGNGDSATVTVALKRTRARTSNVIGWIPGRDTSRTLVVGAHYDHLGFGGESSLAPDSHAPHVGADDNASGVAALIGVAKRLSARARAGRTPEHTLVFAAFTGEEIGLVGSSRFVDQPPRPLETIEAMLNMDMVGRLRDNRLMVMGVGTATEFPGVVERTNAGRRRFDLRTSSDGYGPSDHSSFYKRKIPVLMLFTGAHADYHKPSDTWDKVNAGGLARISAFAAALIETLDARPRVTYSQAKADSTVRPIGGGGGYGAYLGTIPDYMQTEGGVLLSGVRAGGPAEQAGLAAGDTIVQFDGINVDNIYDYTYALRSRKPGQQVRITVKRAGKEVSLIATLGRRPG